MAGPNAQICDECIALCNEIIQDDYQAMDELAAMELPRPKELKEILDQYVIAPGGCQTDAERRGVQSL